MAGTIGRNLNLCFTKIRRPPPPHDQSSTTLLAPDDHGHTFLIKNYNSLYDPIIEYSTSAATSSSSSSSTEPDFATVYASQRFFFSSPGRSNSIIESTPSIVTSSESSDNLVAPQYDSNAPTTNPSKEKALSVDYCSSSSTHPQLLKSPTVKDSVAVPTYSPDPYMDFRRSMQEMVEARDLVDVKANWKYLHELLSCYLDLNPKSSHKFIVGAFADLLVSLLSSQMPEDGGRQEEGFASGGCGVSRQCM